VLQLHPGLLAAHIPCCLQLHTGNIQYFQP